MNILLILSGGDHSLVLTSNGDVLSCGSVIYGQLGRKNKAGQASNVYYSLSFQKIEDLSEITRIKCGYYHSLCIDIKNDLYVLVPIVMDN